MTDTIGEPFLSGPKTCPICGDENARVWNFRPAVVGGTTVYPVMSVECAGDCWNQPWSGNGAILQQAFAIRV